MPGRFPGPALRFVETPPARGGRLWWASHPLQKVLAARSLRGTTYHRARHFARSVLSPFWSTVVRHALRRVRGLRVSQQPQRQPLRARLCGADRLPAEDLAVCGFRLHFWVRRPDDHASPVAPLVADTATDGDRRGDQGGRTASQLSLQYLKRRGAFQDADLRRRSGAGLPALLQGDAISASGLCGNHP